MQRLLLLALFLAHPALAQMPKSFYNWWNKPVITKALNLTPPQMREIRRTVVEFRPRLIDVRAEVSKAEIDLQAQFDHDPVDSTKANQAIERLIAARGDLTRTLSQMSLKLRSVLTGQQWLELQRHRPGSDEDDKPTGESPVQK
jgi:hypothetical protein